MRFLVCTSAVALALAGGVGAASAQRLTIPYHNGLSTSQAEFMVEHGQHMRLASEPMSGASSSSANAAKSEASAKSESDADLSSAKSSGTTSSSMSADATAKSASDPSMSNNRSGGSALSLSDDQQRIVRDNAIAKPAPKAKSADLKAEIGATVPDSIELYSFAANMQHLVPAAAKYDYVKTASNDVLLVDPQSRKVVDIVEPGPAASKKM